jgi:hypothetical protein
MLRLILATFPMKEIEKKTLQIRPKIPPKMKKMKKFNT